MAIGRTVSGTVSIARLPASRNEHQAGRPLASGGDQQKGGARGWRGARAALHAAGRPGRDDRRKDWRARRARDSVRRSMHRGQREASWRRMLPTRRSQYLVDYILQQLKYGHRQRAVAGDQLETARAACKERRWDGWLGAGGRGGCTWRTRRTGGAAQLRQTCKWKRRTMDRRTTRRRTITFALRNDNYSNGCRLIFLMNFDTDNRSVSNLRRNVPHSVLPTGRCIADARIHWTLSYRPDRQ